MRIETTSMAKLYQVNIKRLPLSIGPLAEGHPERKPTPINAPNKFATEADVLRHARKLVQEGYRLSIIDPDGREWPHTEVLRRLDG